MKMLYIIFKKIQENMEKCEVLRQKEFDNKIEKLSNETKSTLQRKYVEAKVAEDSCFVFTMSLLVSIVFTTISLLGKGIKILIEVGMTDLIFKNTLEKEVTIKVWCLLIVIALIFVFMIISLLRRNLENKKNKTLLIKRALSRFE